MKLVTDETISTAYRSALNLGLIDEQDTVVVFVDFSVIDDRLRRLGDAFPQHSLHAVAIKTNPLTTVLSHIVKKGFGLEAASLGEVFLASNVGLEAERLVFDSPAKTVSEIKHLSKNMPGLRINANSIDELDRYRCSDSGFRLGLRVNPLVGSKSVDSMNVSTLASKFGIPINETSSLVRACLKWEDLDCLHLHVGSQFTDLKPTVNAVRKVLDLAATVNRQAGVDKIRYIDIGGGFPVNYGAGKPYFIEDYACELRRNCEELFDGKYSLITEFGRYVHANACWAVSNIEYMKRRHNGVTLITHSGADMFLRECYNPQDWQLRFSVMEESGIFKEGVDISADVAGPLCFGGDYIGKSVGLANVSAGDRLVLHDIGANTFALWSRHCSRPFPKVISLNSVEDAAVVEVAKDRETYEDIVNFWS